VISPVGAAPSDASATAWTVNQNLISEDAQSSQHNMPSELLFTDVVNKHNAALRRDVPRISSSDQVREPSTSNARPRVTILGSSLSTTLKAANTFQLKKSVFRLVNISAVYSADEVSDHIKSLNIRLINCFELPRRVNQPVDNKHFRICISSIDKSILLNKDNWDTGII